VEERFTSVIYSLGQELCYLRMRGREDAEVRNSVRVDTEVPAYVKALLFDTRE